MAARIKAGNARCFFQQCPALDRFGIDQFPDLPLAHQRRRMGPRGGIGKQKLHVPRPHILAVDPVDRSVFPLDTAGNLQHVRIIEGGGGRAVAIVQKKGDLGKIPPRPARGTGKDHIVHSRCPHGLVGAFPHDPAHGFHQVGLAAPVGAHHPGQARLQIKIDRVAKTLEAAQAQALEYHVAPALLPANRAGTEHHAPPAAGTGSSCLIRKCRKRAGSRENRRARSALQRIDFRCQLFDGLFAFQHLAIDIECGRSR